MTTLVAVRAALDASTSTKAAEFSRLIAKSGNTTYKSLPPAKRKFGSSKNDNVTCGRRPSLFEKKGIPSLKELQQLLLEALQTSQKDRNTQPGGPTLTLTDANTSEQESCSERVINSLTNADMLDMLGLQFFFSEALEEVCSNSWTRSEDLLHATRPKCSIVPTDTMLPLHHNSEGTTLATLITGSMVWIIWPSTTKNLNTLQNAHNDLKRGKRMSLDGVAEMLEDGVMFVQNEGDSVRIPPFCPVMCLSSKTAVLVSRSHITYENFVDALNKISFLRWWSDGDVDGDRDQLKIIDEVLYYLDFMLNGIEDENGDQLGLEYSHPTMLTTLLKMWDVIKEELAAMMNQKQHEAVQEIWSKFLIASKGRLCRICSHRCFNKRKLMAKHFAQNHWIEKEVTVDSNIHEQGEGEGGEVRSHVTVSADAEMGVEMDR